MKIFVVLVLVSVCFAAPEWSELGVEKGVEEMSVSDPKGVPYPWTAQWGLTSSSLQSYLQQWTSMNYIPVHIDGYLVHGIIYFAAIAEQKPGQWSCSYNISAAVMNSTNSYWSNMGYHLQRLSVYSDTFGNVYYAAVWMNNGFAPGWQFNTGLTYSSFVQLVGQMTNAGYYPIQVEMYCPVGSSQALFAVIFNQHFAGDPAWFAQFLLTPQLYQQQMNTMSNQGYRPAQVTGVTVLGQQYLGAIWLKPNQAQVWQTQWGMSTTTMTNYGKQYVAQGYQFTDISGYTSSTGDVVYTALWDQVGL